MTFTEAAAEVLRLVGRPLHYKEITDLAIEKNLLSHVGKSPEVTMGARLAALLKKEDEENPLIRVKPGVFALREWDEETIRLGLEQKRTPKKASKSEPAPEKPRAAATQAESAQAAAEDVAETEAASDAAGPESEPEEEPPSADGKDAQRGGRRNPSYGFVGDDEDGAPAKSEEHSIHADAVAGAAELFDEEDDDDQPILGGDRGGEGEGEGRRRRRRRRRGRSGSTNEGRGGLPSYTATPVQDGEGGSPRGPQVIDLSGDGPALDDLAGQELADLIHALLANQDRGTGPSSLRQIAEQAQRRGRLGGDVTLVQSQVAAAIRADNARRCAEGHRIRFRFAGGRVGLTDWLLTSELARLEHEAVAAVERYRDAARRALAKKIGELPGHALVELCAQLFQRLGVTQLRAMRRAGMPGAEAHFTAVYKQPGVELPLAIVIRRDGREVGRERVTELRGALHHYGPAVAAWIATAGQVLSGAREEAATTGVAPVTLFDGAALAELGERLDVGVVRTQMPIPIVDVDLFEALRAS